MLFEITVLMMVIISAILNFWKMKAYKTYYNGPDPLPIIGNAHQVAFGSSVDFLNVMTDFTKKYGSRFRIQLANHLLIFSSNPKDSEALLSSNSIIEKSAEYEYIKPWLGTGLLTSAGEKWRKHRKVITPTFHFKILENFIQVFNSQSDVLIDTLKKQVDKDSFDVFPHITLCALDIIAEAAMGVSVNAQRESDSPYVRAVKEMLRILNGRMRNLIKRNDYTFFLTSDYWIQKRSLKLLHDYTYKMIAERRKILEGQNQNLDSYIKVDDTGVRKKLAFLDMLLLSTIDSKPLSDQDIREEVDTFLFEGHDTTTTAITFALYSIAHHPEIQKKVFAEQREIFGNEINRDVTHTDLQNMKYLELVIKETLRLYPSVPYIGRTITEDVEINSIKVPAGASFCIQVYHMQRDPKVFPEPEKFIPERFLVEECAKRNPFAMVAFSAGPRNCIGQKFAMLEMKSTISKIIRMYELLPCNKGFELTADLILKPSAGVNIKITNRIY